MKNLYIQANRQIHPSEELKAQTIMKMNRQLEVRSWFTSKMALAFASICLCFGLSGLVLQSVSEKNNESGNAGLMLTNESDMGIEAFGLDRTSAYPAAVEDYQLVMELCNEDTSTTLTYQNDNKSFTVTVGSKDLMKVNEGIILEKDNEVLLFESDILNEEELEGFVDYFR